MFNTEKISDFVTKMPKTAAEVTAAVERVNQVVLEESLNTARMFEIYRRSATGDASANDIAEANRRAQQAVQAARFAALMAVPGAAFFLPAMAEFDEKHDLGLVPASVKKNFDL